MVWRRSIREQSESEPSSPEGFAALWFFRHLRKVTCAAVALERMLAGIIANPAAELRSVFEAKYYHKCGIDKGHRNLQNSR